MSNTIDLISTAKSFMPEKYVSKMTDAQIEAYLGLIVDDINAVSPATYYNLESMPSSWKNIVCFGATVYLDLFLVAKYSLEDFIYSDNGLSLQIERGSKIMSVYDKALLNYNAMKINLKKAAAVGMGAKVLATPQYLNVVQTFISTVFPGTVPH